MASHPPPPQFVRLAAHPLRWQLLIELAASDLRVRDLVALAGEPQSLVSYHLRLLRDGGLVTTNRSSFDGRDTFYHLDLDRCSGALTEAGALLHPALRPSLPGAAGGRVLFVCTGNSVRSPIAEALFRHHTGGRVDVASAGNRPRTGGLHPDAVRVLREEYGITVTGQHPQHWDTLSGRRFDYVISLCDRARESCPDFPGDPRRVHWSVPEPSGHPAVARAAADIDIRVRNLLPLFKEVSP
ncbi:ArsR family transcriptional regulator [Actinoplanes sp. GCM10030250]|uniref:arsenate reductase/protein-tyrosine-phosphatase family protein n=1 Tax=Actinoplanes sp. GCM10030250 TaxID=3273376 RepID=UPI0036212BCD